MFYSFEDPLMDTLANSEDPDELSYHMRHFSRVFTVLYDKIDLQREKINYLIFVFAIGGDIITCDPSTQYIQWTPLSLLYVAFW